MLEKVFYCTKCFFLFFFSKSFLPADPGYKLSLTIYTVITYIGIKIFYNYDEF
jgi:hypothetical protein